VSFLRIEYERILGKEINKRTWIRVKSRLKINSENESDPKILPIIRAYAQLRKLNPYRCVTLTDALTYHGVTASMPDVTCTGIDLWASLKRLEPAPSDCIIYKWGKEIGVPMRKTSTDWYDPEQVNKWIIKVVSQTKFKFRPKETVNG
jgi:hypothetical protein